jgi:GTP-binding protein LepA
MVLLESTVDTEDYEELRNSMEKLQLNDASLVFYRKARQQVWFRCGFWNATHGDYSRKTREFNMTVTTVPNVSYHHALKKILILF